MRTTKRKQLRVVYEFVPPGPADKKNVRRELEREFDALFDSVLKAESDVPKPHKT